MKDDGWRIPTVLWEKMSVLIPRHRPKNHPLGCHRKRVSDRSAMDGILFVLRTGCQWNALNGTGICSSSSAHRRFQEWVKAGVFLSFWKSGLLEYDSLKGLDWTWLSMDGAMTKAPLGGEKNWAKSDRSREKRGQAKSADRSQRHSNRTGR
jgi:transposase